MDTYPQTWPSPDILEELRFAIVLRNNEIEFPVGVEIRNGGGALLAIYFDASFVAIHCLERPATISFQPQSPARIVARCLRIDVEKVLAQEQVFIAVAVYVTDADTKGGSKLRFGGQGTSLEVIAAIEEEHGIKRSHLGMLRVCSLWTKNFLDAGAAVRTIGRKLFLHQRHDWREHVQ